MPQLQSSLDIKSDVYKLKLDDCCCDVILITDEGISSKIHFPLLALNNVWWSGLLENISDEGICFIFQDVLK